MTNTEIERLIYLFSKLPGLGKRSSRRIVLHLLQDKDIRLQSLIDELSAINNKVKICTICNNIDLDTLCKICISDNRANNTIAIVETVADLWAIERSGIFNGKYHVLGYTHSNINSINAEELYLPKLLERCKNNNVSELIIATNATLDGQTVAYFITDYFKPYNIKISRLANGIPIGGELDYLDENTLSLAISQRQPFI